VIFLRGVDGRLRLGGDHLRELVGSKLQLLHRQLVSSAQIALELALLGFPVGIPVMLLPPGRKMAAFALEMKRGCVFSS